jgi:CDP-6-deoxy-D-xylo-4-hexulose-3-dehydrase
VKNKIMRVPYGMTVHGQEEIDAVVEVLRTSTQMGKNVREFEEKIAKLFDKKYGLMVNSGSSALYLAVEVLNLPKESEVITPVLTFSTTVASIIKNGLIPSFVDVEPDTFVIDVNKIEEIITKNTKAISIPNLLGNIPDWDKIAEIAQKYNLKIIEDSADTLGGTLRGMSSGYHSDISITSFYGSHVINCAGNGGMICINDNEMYRRAKLLRSWGRSSSIFVESEKIENRFNVELEGIQYDAKFVFAEPGYNIEPSEMGAAFGLVQLNKLQANIEARIENFNKQYEFFKQYEEWFILPKQTPETRTGWLAFPLIVKDNAPFTRTEMQISLEKDDIQTRVIFTGNILRQPGFKDINCVKSKDGYSNADNVMRDGILLACHHGLTDEMLEHIHESFKRFAEKY